MYLDWIYPDLPPHIADLLFQSNGNIVVVGVIGRSAFPDCNKMAAFNVSQQHPSLLEHNPKEGQIQFYYKPNESMLLLHFETTYDAALLQQLMQRELAEKKLENFTTFHHRMRSRFARMLLFATHVCHIVVLVELSVNFDVSFLPLMRSLKIIRERHILKFLPKLVKNSSTGAFLGKAARLCSPRFLFLFENYPKGYEKTKDAISMLEFEMEDNIYKMLRNEFIITNNSSSSLFSIPSNKRFVYFNTNEKMREDPLERSIKILQTVLQKTNFGNDSDELDDYLPYRGFAKPFSQLKKEPKPTADEVYVKEREFMILLKDHVHEALTDGFDDNLTKYKSRNHFELLPAKVWYDIFKVLHKIFIENPDNPNFEANDSDYKAYLESFDEILNVDQKFFTACCDIGLNKAYAMYNDPTLTNYSTATHKKMLREAIVLYRKFARGPKIEINEAKLRELCTQCWTNGKQQCEYVSLRGKTCVLPKHLFHEMAEHSSGHTFVVTCNCGRTQGRRNDPYTLRQANFEYYEFMSNNCNLCVKAKKIQFDVFEPSSTEYRAAEFEMAFPKLKSHETEIDMQVLLAERRHKQNVVEDCSQPITASLGTNLSLRSSVFNKIELDDNDDGNVEASSNSESSSLNELVLQIKDKSTQPTPRQITDEEAAAGIVRQASTTEYLPGLIHTQSPKGLLPLFPSWSLLCVGPSSLYSHNTGLLEHFQSGFLTGSNFLLPWDVHVRLEHAANTWMASNTEKQPRYRKLRELIMLKIFVGFEYECSRGHRFMMSSPDKVLRSSADISRDSGSKVVHNNMPLYFACPCRSEVGQLMRVHVVTPKAPVNVILEPKVRTGEQQYVFTLGLPMPPKLSQSAYWILRLPYIYQGDDVPITPPSEVNSSTAMSYGCLVAGMFGVTETDE